MANYQDRIELLKTKAKGFDIIELIEKEDFLSEIIDLTLAGEDIDEVILDLMNLGFEDITPDFEEVESLAEKEVRQDIS